MLVVVAIKGTIDVDCNVVPCFVFGMFVEYINVFVLLEYVMFLSFCGICKCFVFLWNIGMV